MEKIIVSNEKLLHIIGNYSKKLSLIYVLNTILFKKVSNTNMKLVYICSSFVTILKIIFDKKLYGTRNYVANTCGDKEFIVDGRGEMTWEFFENKYMNNNILIKSNSAGLNVIMNNIKNKSLILYWTLIMSKKIFNCGIRKLSLKRLFPEGLYKFSLSQCRTLLLLYSFGSVFWIVALIIKKFWFLIYGKEPKDNVSKYYIFMCIFCTVCMTIQIEDPKRYKALGCFMFMSIFD